MRFAASPLLIALMWLAVVATALGVALVSHICRQQYAELTAMERAANQMDVDYGRYLLEQSAWGSLQRIETMAAQKLNMRSPQPEEILMVKRN
jgi:cell division protein FtsL